MTEGKKIRRPAAWLACLALAAAPGCAWLHSGRRVDLAPHAQGVWPVFPRKLPPRVMLKIVEMNDERIRTLKCRAAVDVEGQGSFRAIVRCQRPRRLYLLGSKVGVTLFHLWADGSQLAVYAVRDDVIYAGDMDEPAAAGRPRSPTMKFRVLRDAFLNPVRLKPSDEVVEIDGGDAGTACLLVKRGGAARESFVLERRRLLVARRMVFDREGGLAVSASYGDYRRFSGAWLPLKIAVRLYGVEEWRRQTPPAWPKGLAPAAGATIALSRVEVNRPIASKVFEWRRRAPRSVPVRPLRELCVRDSR